MRELFKPQGCDVRRPILEEPDGLKTLKNAPYAKPATGELKLDLSVPAKTDTPPALVVLVHANDVSQLPPEFLRNGRFDGLFFVDLPDPKERAAIWNIVIKKYGRDRLDAQ